MRKFLTIYLLIPLSVYSQSNSFDFHTHENLKKFADNLFCEKDYLRAAEEYESLSAIINDDTINFKIMLCYSELGLYQLSNLKNNFVNASLLKKDAANLYLKNRFIETPNLFYQINDLKTYSLPYDSLNDNYYNKLLSISYLYNSIEGLTEGKIIYLFSGEEKEKVSSFYDWKAKPPYKSPAIAGLLSAIIPGSGKMYVGEWGDGITALVTTSLFAFLAYDNFKADHTTRAWIFTGLGAFFYAGNIYGSVAAAQIFNARINFEFKEGIKLFLEQENYFLPEYEFCK